MGGYLMAKEQDIEALLVDLQTRLAFQDQAISELNDVITDQQQQIDRLREELRFAGDKLKVLGESVEISEQYEKPPHY
jgi:SlyX protein